MGVFPAEGIFKQTQQNMKRVPLFIYLLTKVKCACAFGLNVICKPSTE